MAPTTQTQFSAVFRNRNQPEVERLAALLSLKVRPGWLVALHGDLGAGKTTFARALIRAQLADPHADVPSPTFALVQSYEGGRLPIYHGDLYRLDHPDELEELGLDEALSNGVLILEWPERAKVELSPNRMDITLAEPDPSRDVRDVTLSTASRGIAQALERLIVLDELLGSYAATAHVAPGSEVSIAYLQGDASARAYARVHFSDGLPLILMDSPPMPDGPPVRDGKPYSRVAHLAENLRPFVAVGRHLRSIGLAAPEILALDTKRGALLLEDLGPAVFSAEVGSLPDGADRLASMSELWSAATDVLAGLRRHVPPERLEVPGHEDYTLSTYDAGAMTIECDLLLDWYWPWLFGAPAPADVQSDFRDLWQPWIERLSAECNGLVLRDYHSPNLIWLADRASIERVGIIDFQDAVRGPWAYDLASLLQDARVTVPEALEDDLLASYCHRVLENDPEFDEADLRTAYRALGVQRATKILGIFARLSVRDGKSDYLANIPRLWNYLERNFREPALRPLANWYDVHIPSDLRLRTVATSR